jgi:hypothetical protein
MEEIALQQAIDSRGVRPHEPPGVFPRKQQWKNLFTKLAGDASSCFT